MAERSAAPAPCTAELVEQLVLTLQGEPAAAAVAAIDEALRRLHVARDEAVTANRRTLDAAMASSAVVLGR